MTNTDVNRNSSARDFAALVTNAPPKSLTLPAQHERYTPEESLSEIGIATALAGFAVLCATPLLLYIGRGSDEGITFLGAVRVLHGQIPYRDFFSFYTPGCYYLYALIFRVFGPSLAAARSVLLLYAALFTFLNYMLARRFASPSAAVIAALMVSMMSVSVRFQNLHSWDSTATALLAIYGAVLYLERGSAKLAFVVGLFTGITAMLEQTRGAGLLLGLVFAVFLLRRTDTALGSVRSLWPAALGALLPVICVVSYFAAHHALREMFTGWFWPLDHYTGVNKLPYGNMVLGSRLVQLLASSSAVERLLLILMCCGMMLTALMPLLALAQLAAIGVRDVRHRRPMSPMTMFFSFTGAIFLGNFIATLATSRVDFYRLAYLTPLFFFMLPLLFDTCEAELPTLRKLQPFAVIFIFVSFGAIALVTVTGALQAAIVPTRAGYARTDQPEELLPYMQRYVRAGDHVLFYPYEATYPFLAGTVTPLAYDFLQAGMHTPADFASAMREVERDRTPVVIFDVTFRDIIPQVWPATQAEVVANDPMGDYIFAHYRLCKALRARRRPFVFMVRNDLPCPR